MAKYVDTILEEPMLSRTHWNAIIQKASGESNSFGSKNV
jgi:hypothetical protein